MIVYCDINSLISNPRRHKKDEKDGTAQQEAAAIFRLLNYHRFGRITMQRSNVALREFEASNNPI